MPRTIKGLHHPVMISLPDWPLDLPNGWVDSPGYRRMVAELFRYVRHHAGRLEAMRFRDNLYKSIGAPGSYPRVARLRYGQKGD